MAKELGSQFFYPPIPTQGSLPLRWLDVYSDVGLYSLEKAYAPLYYGLTPINGIVLYASLLSLLLYFMMTLFVEQLRAAFMFFACFGHLKLNLSVYDSPPASSSFALAVHFSFACKRWGSMLAVGTCSADLRLSVQVPSWEWEGASKESTDVFADLSVKHKMGCCWQPPSIIACSIMP